MSPSRPFSPSSFLALSCVFYRAINVDCSMPHPLPPLQQKYEFSIPLVEQPSPTSNVCVLDSVALVLPARSALWHGVMRYVGLPLYLDHVSHSVLFVLVVTVILPRSHWPSPFSFLERRRRRRRRRKRRVVVVVVEGRILLRVVVRCALSSLGCGAPERAWGRAGRPGRGMVQTRAATSQAHDKDRAHFRLCRNADWISVSSICSSP